MPLLGPWPPLTRDHGTTRREVLYSTSNASRLMSATYGGRKMLPTYQESERRQNIYRQGLAGRGHYSGSLRGFVFNPFAEDDDASISSTSPTSPTSGSAIPSSPFSSGTSPASSYQPSVSATASGGKYVVVADAPASHPRIIPHIIGEDDPFNPFSTTIFDTGDSEARSIMTAEGKIVAPIPRLPMAAALASFELAALAAYT
ncbi:hypothetical protein DXG01_006642 [Tephrocybe rancida]|nr:hypothetical protein DXG01_006642 [Tephrocybe rancida]